MIDGQTFDEVDEEVRLVEIVAEAEVESAQWDGAAVPTASPAGAPLLLQGGFAHHGRLMPVGLVAAVTAGIQPGRRGGILVQPHMDGRLPFVELRLEGPCAI